MSGLVISATVLVYPYQGADLAIQTNSYIAEIRCWFGSSDTLIHSLSGILRFYIKFTKSLTSCKVFLGKNSLPTKATGNFTTKFNQHKN